MNHGLSRETLAAQAMGDIDAASGALVPAIHPSTTYERSPDGTYRSGLVYTRADNPTYDHAERLLATLEGGAAGMLFASGSAAATAVFQALLPGDHVLVSRVLYWGVRKWLAEFGVAWGLDVEFIDTTDLGAVRTAIRPGRTRLVWVETPANPMWDITDLAAVAAIAHAADVRVAVDGTVATPVLTRPATATSWPGRSSARVAIRSASGSGRGGATPAACSARSRRGCSSGACGPCSSGCAARPRVPWPSPVTSMGTRR
jgi:cystathionine gamma-synthase